MTASDMKLHRYIFFLLLLGMCKFTYGNEEWIKDNVVSYNYYHVLDRNNGLLYVYRHHTYTGSNTLYQIYIADKCELDTIDIRAQFSFEGKMHPLKWVDTFVGYVSDFDNLPPSEKNDYIGPLLTTSEISNDRRHQLHLNIHDGVKVSRIASFRPTSVTIMEGADISKNKESYIFGSGVTSVEFVKPLSSLPPHVFERSWIKEFDFTPYTSVGEYAFKDSWLESVDLSRTAQIGKEAFVGTRLKEVDLSGVERIGDEAFAELPLEKVVMPDSLEYMGAGVFRGTQLRELDLRRTIVNATNCDVVKECRNLSRLIAPNLTYLSEESLSGTLIDRIEGYPKLEVICEPTGSRAHYIKIDAPAARHIELRYADIDTLVIGAALADRTFAEEVGDKGNNSYYKDNVFPGIQPGNSWIGHIEINQANDCYFLDDDQGLVRRNKKVSTALPIKYLDYAVNHGDLPERPYDPWNGNRDYNNDYITPVVTRAIPVEKRGLYMSSEHLPGGTVICDQIDTVFINTPITLLNYTNGCPYIPSTDCEYYRRLSLRLDSLRPDNPVMVYIHPDVMTDKKSLEMMICPAPYAPSGIPTRSGTMPDYGFYASEALWNSYRFITYADDTEGVIDRLMSGLDEVTTDGRLNVTINGRQVTLSDMKPGESWKIFSATGRTIALGTADHSGEASVRLPSSGLYVVTSGTAVRKIAVH